MVEPQGRVRNPRPVGVDSSRNSFGDDDWRWQLGENARGVCERWSKEVSKQRENQKVCGVVKARVTSHQRLRVRLPPAAKAAVAQLAEQWKYSSRTFPPHKFPVWRKERVTSGRAPR